MTLPDHQFLSLANVAHLRTLDYSVHDAAVYFSDSKDGFIKMLRIKDSGRVSLKKIRPIEGHVISLALDWLSGNIYWLGSQSPFIHVTTSNGRYAHVLISDGLYNPTSLVLHPPTAAMCLADTGTEDRSRGPKIECASMDGSKRRVLWRKSRAPVGLTIVDAGTRLYWADQGE